MKSDWTNKIWTITMWFFFVLCECISTSPPSPILSHPLFFFHRIFMWNIMCEFLWCGCVVKIVQTFMQHYSIVYKSSQGWPFVWCKCTTHTKSIYWMPYTNRMSLFIHTHLLKRIEIFKISSTVAACPLYEHACNIFAFK